MAASDVIQMYGAAWSEPDEDARRNLLEKAWAEDGVYIDPTARVEGREALVAHTGGFRDRMAGHRIETTTGVDDHDGYFRFGWKVVGPDGSQVMEGVDFGAFDDDGRIKLLVGFFGPWPTPEAQPSP